MQGPVSQQTRAAHASYKARGFARRDPASSIRSPRAPSMLTDIVLSYTKGARRPGHDSSSPRPAARSVRAQRPRSTTHLVSRLLRAPCAVALNAAPPRSRCRGGKSRPLRRRTADVDADHLHRHALPNRINCAVPERQLGPGPQACRPQGGLRRRRQTGHGFHGPPAPLAQILEPQPGCWLQLLGIVLSVVSHFDREGRLEAAPQVLVLCDLF